MNNILRTLACAAALASASALAQSEEPEEDAEGAVESGMEEPKPPAGGAQGDKVFHLMPLCRLAEGRCELMRPGSTEWTAIEEDRFYPLGCSFRAVGPDSRMVVQFGPESEAVLSGDSSFGVLPGPLGDRKRTVALMSGRLAMKLPRNLEQGLFSVTAPGFTAYDLAGESLYTYRNTGDGDEAVVRCVTGLMAIKGRHFDIPRMTVANELRIRTSQDLLFTGLYGNSGDFVVRLDQGVVSVRDFESGAENVQSSMLDWHLSPKTAVRIHRAMPTIGERMSVTVMTFDASGDLKNRCAFAEGRAEINTGEQGVGALAALEAERAKMAAEAADAVSEEEGDEEESSEDDSSEGDAQPVEAGGDDIF